MNGTRVCSALGLFILEFIQLTQHIDRNPDMVIRKSINGMGVMQQNVCIKNVVLDACFTPIERIRQTRPTCLFDRFLKEAGLIF